MTLPTVTRIGVLAGLTVLGLVTAATPAFADRAPEVTLTGVVSDASGQGWPLWADVVVTDSAGAAVTTTTSDPWTGRYQVAVPADQAHTVRVTAGYSGYQETTTAVPAGAEVANVALPVDTHTCVATGYHHTSDGLVESFDTGTLPDGWSLEDAVGAGHVWRFDDPGERTNRTGGSGAFAILDAANYRDPNEVDAALVSPPADLSDVAEPEIGFTSDFMGFGFGRSGIGELDLSVDGGASWRNVWRNDNHAPGPNRVVVPVPEAAGEPDVRVRFRYLNGPITPGRWWGIDDVFVGNRSCDARPGGLVVGTVRDGNTGTPLVGATVGGTVGSTGGTATTVATPDDPALGDGFYWVFSSTTGDDRSFTAENRLYQTGTGSIRVSANQANRLDFDLAAGRVEVAVDEVTGDPALGGLDSTELSVRNTGSAPAKVTVVERPGEFELQDAPRVLKAEAEPEAEPRLVHGEFTPYRLGEDTGALATTAPAGTEWASQGDMPMRVADNVAAEHDGVIYSLAGRSGARRAIQDALAYDTGTGAWSRIANLPHGREKPVAGFVDGKLYVVGGWGTGFPVDMIEQLDVYDPATDTWAAGTDIPKPVGGGGSAVLDGDLYVVGGCLSEADCGTATVQRYRPATDTWDTVADYPEPLAWVSCGTIEAKIFCTGGTKDRNTSRATYSYDPGPDRWTRRADLPIDLWASATTVANGRLLVSGGVTDGTSTITNQGFAYDPAADVWSPLPNARNSVYRGAGACGFYKLGGGSGSVVGTPFVELLAGNGECGSDRDADWLRTGAGPVTLRPGERVAMTVGFDARNADQPGTFAADLLLRTDTPYRTTEVPVTMTVAAPRTWGQVTGTVTEVSCAGVVGPLRDATITVTGRSGASGIQTNAAGGYARWLPVEDGPYTLVAAMDGHVPVTAKARPLPGRAVVTNLTLERMDC